MKNFLSFLLVISLVFSVMPKCIADNSGEFVFRNNISWGMSPKEVLALEKNSNVERLQKTGFDYEYICYDKVAVSSYSDAQLCYAFHNKSLYSTIYILQDSDETKASQLTDALKYKYGNGEELDNRVLFDVVKILLYFIGTVTDEEPFELTDIEIIVLMSAMPSWEGLYWKLADGTTIAKCSIDNSGEYIFYMSPDKYQSQYNTDGL